MRSRRSRRSRVSKSAVEQTRIYHKDEVTKKSTYRWFKILGITLAALVLFFGGMAYGVYTFIKGYSSQENLHYQEYGGRINVLALGVDGGVNGNLLKTAGTGTRSDVMILVSVDPETKEVGVLSIPRDTRVFIPEINSFEKIAHAHAYGGPELAVKTVEDFLKVKIHAYVQVDFEGFKKIIDTLGGVEINIPEKMHYEDPYQNLFIDLEPGLQTLDGEKALQFVRYRRYIDGDIGRIRAQEQFLKAVMDKALRITTLPKIPALIEHVRPYVVTDLSNEEILTLAHVGLNIKPENVKMGIVPGEPGYIADGDLVLSYWLADRNKTLQVVDEIIRGIDREKNAEIKVIVQNGCGVQGAADYLASILRGQGFDVISVENANHYDYQETQVLAAKENTKGQVLVLRSIKETCSEAKAYESNEVPAEADVVVIIGKDFKRLALSSKSS